MPSVSRFTSRAVGPGLCLGLVLSIWTVPVIAAAEPPEPGFWVVGAPASNVWSSVRALNQDGSVAAGFTSGVYQSPGFTWTRETGRFDFGLLPGISPASAAYGLSDNGVVVGSMNDFSSSRAYRWAGSGPLQDLGVLTGHSRSYGQGVSGDGNIVVGTLESGDFGFTGEAFRWTPTGQMQGLGWLRPGSIRSEARGVSRDGGTIVGMNMDSALTAEAFKWTEAGGFEALPNLPNSALSAEAHAVNADGSVVVGASFGPNFNNHAVRWTDAGVEDLSAGSPFGASRAWAVSDDGDVIGGNAGTFAFVWTQETKMMLAIDYLALFGVAVPNEYKLEYVYAISGDGLTFGGIAKNLVTNQFEGWVATIPAPGAAGVLMVVTPMVLASRRRRA